MTNTTTLKTSLLASRAAIDAALAQLEASEGQQGRWLTVKEAAGLLGKTETIIRGMAKSGALDSKRTEGGGKIYVFVKSA